MKKITAALVALLMGAGATLITAPAAEAAAVGDLRIRNAPTSDRSLLVCKDWGATSCRASSLRAYLPRGATSWWDDADGFYVPAGCDVVLPSSGVRFRTTGWTKAPGFFGTTRTYRVDC